MKVLVTGGLGFIGSSFIRELAKSDNYTIANIDSKSYASNLDAISEFEEIKKYSFYHENICDESAMQKIFHEFSPDWIVNFAAETHVDRSIDSPQNFIDTNIFGTYNLLQSSLDYYSKNKKSSFRFLHISTDEVYGDVQNISPPDENSPYFPNSPYSASKASSDHLVRAWNKTFGLPTLISNCTNNYGPFQFPEKLIPLIIIKALNREKLPVYGDGSQIRDWLHVEDHAKAILILLKKGLVGESYNISGGNQIKNIEVIGTSGSHSVKILMNFRTSLSSIFLQNCQ